MKSFGTYISKHLISFLAFILVIVFLNIIAILIVFQNTVFNDYGETAPPGMLEAAANGSSAQSISPDAALLLQNNHIWAMYLNENGSVNWSVDLPSEIPSSFTLQDVALFSRGYLADYPVFIRSMAGGLLVLGYPKDSYTKLLSNYYSLRVIRLLPAFTAIIFILDLLLLFGAYYHSKRKIMRHTRPIIHAITMLSDGVPSQLDVPGELSGIADSINQASLALSRQNAARANWIDGVSHDIRTPLSLIMGYAGKMAQDNAAPALFREQAKTISKQCQKIREFLQDLNLVSKLEYEMQPLNTEEISFSRLLRSYTADLLNSGLSDDYPIALTIDPEAEPLTLVCDRRLITRAINNLVQNSIRHNPSGCHIELHLVFNENAFRLSVSDNGIGLTEEQKKKLSEKNHYMEDTDECLDLHHGLGLILVKEIVKAHGGSYQMDSQYQNGYCTTLSFPAAKA